MTYNSNTPRPSDFMSTTQPIIKDNFGEIKNSFELNHGNFGDPDEGKHLYIQMPTLDDNFDISTDPNEIGAYVKQSNSSGTGRPSLYIKRENNGIEIEATGSYKNNNGWTLLPSGVLIKWGQLSGVNNLRTIAFPTGPNIPVFADVYCISIATTCACGSSTVDVPLGRFIRLVDWTNTSFRVFSSYRTQVGNMSRNHWSGCSYMAIGRI